MYCANCGRNDGLRISEEASPWKTIKLDGSVRTIYAVFEEQSCSLCGESYQLWHRVDRLDAAIACHIASEHGALYEGELEFLIEYATFFGYRGYKIDSTKAGPKRIDRFRSELSGKDCSGYSYLDHFPREDITFRYENGVWLEAPKSVQK